MIKVRCPICDRLMEGSGPAEFPHLPFCGERCRRIDLGRWLGEVYRLPAKEANEEPIPEDLNESSSP